MDTIQTGEMIESSDTIDTIYARRSVRQYTNKPVSKQLLEDILDAARMAPTAMNRQSWKFYVLSNKEIIESLSKEIARVTAAEYLKHRPVEALKAAAHSVAHFLHPPHNVHFTDGLFSVFHGAPVVIFITAPRGSEWGALDVGMSAQNIMLAAKALGLDTCPVGMAKYAAGTKTYARLAIPDEEEVYIAIVVGYGNETPVAADRVKGNVIFIE